MIDLLQLFLTHLQGYKRQAVWSPILIVVEVICELLLPLVMAEIVDTAIPAGDETYIFQLGAVMLVLAGVAMLCGVLAAKYSAFASQGFGANLRQCLFDKVQEFSFADIDRFSSASLITRMTNDVNAMTMMLAMGLRMLVRAPVMLIAALAARGTTQIEDIQHIERGYEDVVEKLRALGADIRRVYVPEPAVPCAI